MTGPDIPTWGRMVHYAISLEATYNASLSEREAAGWPSYSREEFYFNLAMVGIGRYWTIVHEMAMQETVGKMIELLRTPAMGDSGKPN